ncbi:hypothetical protein V1477_003908 [Vespula maculifrons]|uniref:Uncharacterized protein n=1 Tax=Vespula maculifrons TaxID=7453 RepID=A0ABD2CSB3_VESMC
MQRYTVSNVASACCLPDTKFREPLMCSKRYQTRERFTSACGRSKCNTSFFAKVPRNASVAKCKNYWLVKCDENMRVDMRDAFLGTVC